MSERFLNTAMQALDPKIRPLYRGYTMLELVLVLAIISTMAAIVVPRWNPIHAAL